MTNDQKLLLDDKATAAALGIGKSLLWSLHSAGRVPLPVKLGRRTLWRREELEAWCRAGCPTREKWQTIKDAKTND